jgi:hypothetical protein
MGIAIETPRRSKRLVTRNDLPPTPESLPRSSDRSESKFKIRKIRRRVEVEIVVPARRPKRAVKVQLEEVKTGHTDHGMVGPIGKIHLIQGEYYYYARISCMASGLISQRDYVMIPGGC